MFYDNFDRLVDLMIVIGVIVQVILMYGYGQWQYDKGLREGQKQRRRLNREIRRGNVYQLK